MPSLAMKPPSDPELPRKTERKWSNKKKTNLPENEREHPRHKPYVRTNKGILHHNLMVDGLGDEDDGEF